MGKIAVWQWRNIVWMKMEALATYRTFQLSKVSFPHPFIVNRNWEGFDVNKAQSHHAGVILQQKDTGIGLRKETRTFTKVNVPRNRSPQSPFPWTVVRVDKKGKWEEHFCKMNGASCNSILQRLQMVRHENSSWDFVVLLRFKAC